MRRIIFAICFLYLILSVFLRGYPLNFLPASFWNPAVAIALFAICLLPKLPKPNFEWLWVGLILVAAAAVRFNSLGQASHSGPTIDEPIVVDPVLAMIRTGSLDFKAYEYGGVGFYLMLIVFLLYFIHLTSTFAFRNFADVPEQNFYTAGRYATAFLSLLTVGLTYLTARRYFGKLTAIIASLLIAFSSVSFENAHQIRIDIPLTLFVQIGRAHV